MSEFKDESTCTMQYVSKDKLKTRLKQTFIFFDD